ncbi:MAG: rhodanese-like domain-containing protein [Magnetococcales bacterium]|nr:rhodanese-like domain-containing protein [Magnetococcales bacterium]
MPIFGKKTAMPIEEFLADPALPVIIDVRGYPDSDPAIPGSHKVYVLEIEEKTEAFEKRFASMAAGRPLLLYCSKGESSSYLVGKLSGKNPAYSLQGGMAAYLTTISRLLHEHPYEDPSKRGDTMVKILNALTNRATDPATFRKIMERLMRCTSNPKFRKLVAGMKKTAY